MLRLRLIYIIGNRAPNFVTLKNIVMVSENKFMVQNQNEFGY